MKNIAFLLLLLTALQCKKPPLPPVYEPVSVSTDKAAYNPGDAVVFTIDKNLPPSAKIRYKYLNTVMEEVAYSGNTWTWNAPTHDFRGYMVELYNVEDNAEKIYGSIAVDVSSNWTRFPRYGFLSKFGATEDVESVIANLNRYHINGLQFYDWHYKHHQPLAGTPAAPAEVWKDIINRDNYRNTVQHYITAAHNRNMKAMFYNLANGATNTYAADGVLYDWFLFRDEVASLIDHHDLPEPPFTSDIFLLDPNNTEWQQYLAARTNDVYAAYDFDGYHIDQLGDRGQVFNNGGVQIALTPGYKSFTEAMKAAAPDKYHVFNAVNQFGQDFIAQSPVDFLYTEVWSPNESYADLANLINSNNSLTGGAKKTVLAAYMNYQDADHAGFYFNTPSVLLTDAVIFAFGGAHIELGEHMLGKEYFPNENLLMPEALKTALIAYYDFSVAYQNVLRDGGALNAPAVMASGGSFPLNAWPPQIGNLAISGRDLGDKQVIHLLNFIGLSSLDWRDANGQKLAPSAIQNLTLNFTSAQPVSKVWFASPDIDGGSSKTLNFTQSGDQVTFTLPSLAYWDMVVVEY